MANMMDKYVSDTAEIAAPDSESFAQSKQRTWLKKKELRAIKALTKALRKRNKLMKQEAARRKAEEDTVEMAAKVPTKAKHGHGVRGFWEKLGDAICRAIPKLLTTLAPLAFGYLFKRLVGKAPQVA